MSFIASVSLGSDLAEVTLVAFGSSLTSRSSLAVLQGSNAGVSLCQQGVNVTVDAEYQLALLKLEFAEVHFALGRAHDEHVNPAVEALVDFRQQTEAQRFHLVVDFASLLRDGASRNLHNFNRRNDLVHGRLLRITSPIT
jgi:hypothetical protein